MRQVKTVTSFLVRNKKILLLKRSNKVGTYHFKWSAVSGHMEKGKSAYAQAIKEIREETGLKKSDLKLIKKGKSIKIPDKKYDVVWHVKPFKFRVISKSKITLDWEHIELKWILPEKISRYRTVPKLIQTWQTVN